MANNIKGITVEIGGDTTPLNKALKGVNDTGKSLQDQLKEVNRQLKFDPNNTVLLQQKQELLTKEIENTSQKLSTLKEAEKQAQEQFAQGKISQEQYQALQREVIKTESQLKNLGKQAGLTNAALDKVAVTTGKIGKAATDLGKGLMPVTAGITAAGVAAVAAYTDVDKGADTVIEKTGATGAAAKEMVNAYKDVAASVPDDMQEVGNAVGEINTRLEFTGDKLKTASEDFLKFAKINNTDVNTSVQLVSRAMGDAGIDANDYKSVLDELTVAGQKSGISIDSLTENLAKYGAPMRALGLDTKTSIAMFAGWEKAGVNTEIAFSGMKKAISTWGSEGKDSREEFQKTLEEIKNAPDIAAATTQAIAVFGQKAGPDLADAIKGGRFEVRDYIDALNNSAGAVENTYSGIVDGTDDAKTAMNAAKVAASELGGTVLEALAPVLQKVAAVAKRAAEGIGSMDDGTKRTILTVAAVVAAVAPALLIAGKIASGISAVTGAMAMAKTATIAQTAAQYGWNAALLTSPITWIVVGIAAVVAAVVLLFKNCKPFHDWVMNALKTVESVAKTVFGAIVTFFAATIPGAWRSLVSFFQGIPAWWSNLWTQVGQFFKTLWSGIISFITTTIPRWVNSFIQWIQKLPYNIGVAIGTMLAHIVNFGVKAWAWITTTLPQIIQGIINWFAQLPGEIWSVLTDIIVKIGLWVSNMVLKVATEVPKIINRVVNFFAQLPGKVWAYLANVVSKVVQWAANLVSTAATEIPKFVSTVVNFISELPGKMLDIGANIVKGIWNGINSAIDWLHSMIADFCSGIINGFKTALQIHSPSQLFADIVGKNIALGIGQGFIGNMKSVVATMTDAIPTTWDTGVQVRTALAYGGSYSYSSGASEQTSTLTPTAGGDITVKQYFQGKVPTPAETARQTRNGLKQVIKQLKR